jgi:hypothetical protein
LGDPTWIRRALTVSRGAPLFHGITLVSMCFAGGAIPMRRGLFCFVASRFINSPCGVLSSGRSWAQAAYQSMEGAAFVRWQRLTWTIPRGYAVLCRYPGWAPSFMESGFHSAVGRTTVLRDSRGCSRADAGCGLPESRLGFRAVGHCGQPLGQPTWCFVGCPGEHRGNIGWPSLKEVIKSRAQKRFVLV